MTTSTPSDRLLLRPVEAAERMGVSLRSLMAWTAAGEIPAIRIGARCLRYSVDDLRAWIDAHRTGPLVPIGPEVEQTAPADPRGPAVGAAARAAYRRQRR
jgi:excisionase family DNA binding protein